LSELNGIVVSVDYLAANTVKQTTNILEAKQFFMRKGDFEFGFYCNYQIDM